MEGDHWDLGIDDARIHHMGRRRAIDITDH